MKRSSVLSLLLVLTSLSLTLLSCTKKSCQREVKDYFLIENTTGDVLKLELTSTNNGHVETTLPNAESGEQMVTTGTRSVKVEAQPGKVTPAEWNNVDCTSGNSEEQVKINSIKSESNAGLVFTMCNFSGEALDNYFLIVAGANQPCPNGLIRVQ